MTATLILLCFFFLTSVMWHHCVVQQQHTWDENLIYRLCRSGSLIELILKHTHLFCWRLRADLLNSYSVLLSVMSPCIFIPDRNPYSFRASLPAIFRQQIGYKAQLFLHSTSVQCITPETCQVCSGFVQRTIKIYLTPRISAKSTLFKIFVRIHVLMELVVLLRHTSLKAAALWHTHLQLLAQIAHWNLLLLYYLKLRPEGRNLPINTLTLAGLVCTWKSTRVLQSRASC